MRDLLPATHRAERQLLLDLLADRATALRVGTEVDADAFLAIIPDTLYPLAFAKLRSRAGELGVPGSLVATLAASYRGNLMLHLKRRALLRTTVALFNGAGIPHLVLKGPVLAQTVYDDPVTRTMSDLDFLFHAKDIGRAFAALEVAGYRVPSRLQGVELEPGDGPPVEPPGDPDMMIESHTILDSTGEDESALDAAWSRVRSADLDGLSVMTLAPTDFFTSVVMHLSKHHRFEGMLRSLVDVTLLMRLHAGDFDWPALREEWTTLGIIRWMSLTMTLAEALLDAPLPPVFREDAEGLRDMLPMAAAQLWATNLDRVAPRFLYALAGRQPSIAHPHAHRTRAPLPAGLAGVRARAAWLRVRLDKFIAAVRMGALRPGRVAESLRQFRQREELAALLSDK
jgi:hypothetical protein